jgi:hypothetical protein
MMKAPSTRSVTSAVLFTLLILPIGVSLAADAQDLTPRQLFYKTREDSPGAAQPETKSSESSKKRPAPKPAAPDTARAPRSNGTSAKSEDTDLMRLALRYAILQPDQKGELQEVDPAKIFHTKEHFRFKFQSKDTAFLYVMIRQSQGSWKVLIPFKDMDESDKTLIHGRVATIPSDRDLTFDNHPGVEELFVVLSKEPFQDLEHLMNSVRRPSQTSFPLVASADIEKLLNPLVSRGIDVESISGQVPGAGAKPENAVYVANVKSPAAPRLVVSIVLKHE